ncbi:15040_t:CDS:1, partial [Funneliformis geosporum]
ANLNKGYSIEHHGLTDLTNMTTQHLTERISSLAYMDDTNWIASSQEDLEEILKVAEEFYSFTRSALNKDKSKLLSTYRLRTNNIKLKFGSSTIDITPEKGSIRFLGVWINTKRSPTFVKNQIKQDIR